MEPILECRGLEKRYGQGVQALRRIDLALPRGRIVGLLGPNGSGKSTLMKLCNGLLTPSAGSLYIQGQPVGVGTKPLVSYLPDRNYLNDWMRVEELVGFFADFYSNFDTAKAHEILERLGLNPRDRLKTLSKGNKEKVQLILVMSRQVPLYLLDEPIGGVDPAARDYILRTILANYSENATILLSTHLIADVEKILDDVIFLKQGEVALSASVEQLREERGTSVDALFREVFKC